METMNSRGLKNLESWGRQGIRLGDIQSCIGMRVQVMRGGWEFGASCSEWPKQGQGVRRVIWKVNKAEAVYWRLWCTVQVPPFSTKTLIPSAAGRSQGPEFPQGYSPWLKVDALSKAMPPSLGATHTQKGESTKAQHPCLNSGHLWRAVWASELPKDLLKLLLHLPHSSTPPFAPSCFLHSLTGIIPRSTHQ